MSEIRLDPEGRLALPGEVMRELGWQPGDSLILRVEGDQLLVQPGNATNTLKQDARRLVDAMRSFTMEAAAQVAEAVKPHPESTGGANWGSSAPPRPPATPAPSAAPAAAAPPPAPAPSAAAPTASTAPGGATGYRGAFEGIMPHVPESVFLALGSTVIGDVSLGEDCSVWPGAVLRGDVAPVRLGPRTNIQEGAVLHVSPQQACVLGAGVTVGHQATVHACTIGDDSLIGIHAVVLDGARIGKRCIVAAGAVVPPGTEVPDGKMVMGVPGKVVRDLTPEEIERIHWHADSYVSLKNQYLSPTPPPVVRDPAPRTAPPEQGTLPRHECRRARGAIVVDGSLDDPGWDGIAPLSPLVHAENGGTPQFPTEVRVCWDDTHLYVGFACKDADIWGNFEHRDDPIYDEEVVEFFLCPTGNLAHYYELQVSPLNVVFDAKVFNPEGDRRSMLLDREWDAAGLRTAVRVSGKVNDRDSPDIGWMAEAALPFADLGLEGPPTPGTVWRVNFYRIERGESEEYTAWSPTYRDPADFHVPACFGELVFAGE